MAVTRKKGRFVKKGEKLKRMTLSRNRQILRLIKGRIKK